MRQDYDTLAAKIAEAGGSIVTADTMGTSHKKLKKTKRGPRAALVYHAPTMCSCLPPALCGESNHAVAEWLPIKAGFQGAGHLRVPCTKHRGGTAGEAEAAEVGKIDRSETASAAAATVPAEEEVELDEPGKPKIKFNAAAVSTRTRACSAIFFAFDNIVQGPRGWRASWQAVTSIG